MALFRGEQGRLRSGWRAAIFALLLVVCAGLGTTLALSVVPVASGPLEPWRLSVAWGGLVAGSLAAHWVMLRFIDRVTWRYAAMHREAAAPRVLARGVLLGALPIGLTAAALVAAGWLTVTRAGGSALGMPVLGLMVMFLVAALFEELVLRGYLLSALSDGIGRVGAVLATSLVFGLLHLRNPGVSGLAVTVVVVAGIFLAAVRMAMDSLYAAWAAHAAWNMVMALVLHTAVSGTSIAPPGGWRVVDSGPDWATGGPWGPEGGAPAAAALLVATWYLIRRRQAPPADPSIARLRGESAE